MPVTRAVALAFLALALLASPGVSFAAEEKPAGNGGKAAGPKGKAGKGDEAEGEPKAKAAAEGEAPKKLEAVVHRFYIEMKVGGGYMLLNQPLVPDGFHT